MYWFKNAHGMSNLKFKKSPLYFHVLLSFIEMYPKNILAENKWKFLFPKLIPHIVGSDSAVSIAAR
jgi:hypothetical protein